MQQLHGWKDVAVVVSSSWRMFFDDGQLREVLLPISQWYVGSAGSSYLGRSIAIRRWLELNEITEFAVLDDEPSYCPRTAASAARWPTTC
ncbi:HAD domain-containing protein [Comamonas terrigena]|uniref:HAD domain-containing protein n=1 Tax=Comamonas terrigena TaxID=32013 RepID=UPI0035E458BC